MSHVTTINVQVKDLEAMRAACARLGFEFKEGQRQYKWWGISVGDYPLPEGVTAEQLGHCDHAISVPGAAYEVGLVQRGDHYALLWDWFEPSTGTGLKRFLGQNGEKLIQAYAVEAAKAEAMAQGYSCWEEAMEDGSVNLHVQVGG